MKRLAVGGMAELFLARDTRSARFVVLKRILPYLAEEEEFLRMFLDEARIAASLHHPNIVELLELGRLDNNTFIAMEWVNGIDMRRLLTREQDRGGPLPTGVAAWIVARLCEGLSHAHHRTDAGGAPIGIVHRDISPQNVMITFTGDVKLVDFGIAKATAWMDRSKPGVIKGKFLYIAPEQLTQEKLDYRADLFSTGTLLYELTTGKTPFQRPTSEEVIYAVRMEDPEPPGHVRPGYPMMLSRIIMKCLQKDRSRRYQSAAELRSALEDFMRMDAPTTKSDVVRYVGGLFGSIDEHTALMVPSPPSEPEPTLQSQPSLVSAHSAEVPDDGEGTATELNTQTEDLSQTPRSLSVSVSFSASATARPPPLPPRKAAARFVASPPPPEPTAPPLPLPVPTPVTAPLPPPPPRRAPPRRPGRSPPQHVRSPSFDADDFIATSELRQGPDDAGTRGDRRGRWTLFGIAIASSILLGLLLALILSPSEPMMVASREAGERLPSATAQPAPVHQVRVALRAPRALQISIDGAQLPGTSFQQPPGRVTLSWKCRQRRRLVEYARTFDIPDVPAAILELPCPP